MLDFPAPFLTLHFSIMYSLLPLLMGGVGKNVLSIKIQEIIAVECLCSHNWCILHIRQSDLMHASFDPAHLHVLHFLKRLLW